jgi:hypothetical protein
VARGDLESNPVEAMRKPSGSKPRTNDVTAAPSNSAIGLTSTRSACAEQRPNISSAGYFGQPNPFSPAEGFND